MQLSVVFLAFVAVGLARGEEQFFRLGNIVLPRRQATDNTYVAFSAGLTHNVNLAANATIMYDKVFINSGNGYDSTTGVFTCPHDGLYVFIYHGLSETAGTMWMDLYKNSDYQVTGYAHNANDYAAASNSVTLQLAAGDTVYVRGHGTNQLYGRTDEIYATFSGFALFSNTRK